MATLGRKVLVPAIASFLAGIAAYKLSGVITGFASGLAILALAYVVWLRSRRAIDSEPVESLVTAVTDPK